MKECAISTLFVTCGKTQARKNQIFFFFFFSFNFHFNFRSVTCDFLHRALGFRVYFSLSLSSLVFRREEDRVAGEMLGGREVALAGECCPCDTSTSFKFKTRRSEVLIQKANFLKHKGHSIGP